MNEHAVQEASVHNEIAADNYNRHAGRQHTQSVQGEENELSHERNLPQEMETPKSASQLNTQVQKATKRKKSAESKKAAKRKKLAKRKKAAKRKISPLFIATCTLVVTMIGVGVAINMSNRAGDAALQVQIESVRSEIRELEDSLRSEIQHVNDRVDDIYLYLIESNPPTQ